MDGHCLLRGHFPRQALEACWVGFLPLLKEVACRVPEGNRCAIGLPFAPPFYHSAFVVDEVDNLICGRILADDLHIVYNMSFYFPEREQTRPLEANQDTPRLIDSFYQSLSDGEQRLLRRLPRAPGAWCRL